MRSNKLNIVEVIWQRLHLQKIGKNFWCMCPFHSPPEHSMVVLPRANRFYCLSCQENGDSIDFLRKYEGEDLNINI